MMVAKTRETAYRFSDKKETGNTHKEGQLKLFILIVQRFFFASENRDDGTSRHNA